MSKPAIDRLQRMDRQLATVHTLRVTRLRAAHQVKQRAVARAQKTYDDTRVGIERLRQELAQHRHEMEAMHRGRIYTADELLRVATRLHQIEIEEKALTRRIEIALKALERAQAEAAQSAAELQRALMTQERTHEHLQQRVGDLRRAAANSADERILDDMAARRGRRG